MHIRLDNVAEVKFFGASSDKLKKKNSIIHGNKLPFKEFFLVMSWTRFVMHCASPFLPVCLFICSAILCVSPCSITNLQTELRLVCEERDKLTQELKRTPELIDKSLAHLKEQCEHPYNSQHPLITHHLFICWVLLLFATEYVSVYLCMSSTDEGSLKQQQQELEQSWAEVQQAVAGREEAEQRLQQIQAQLEESRVNLEEVSSELCHQQERSERGEAAVVVFFFL